MKKQIISVALASLIVASCSDSAKLNYARKMFNEKAYSEAMKIAESASPNSKERNAIVATSAFKNLQMQKAVDFFALIPVAELSDDEKSMYCEALRQTGNSKLCMEVAQSAGTAPWALNYTKPAASAKDSLAKIESLDWNSPFTECSPFYYSGSLYFLTDKDENYRPDALFRWNAKPFLEIKAEGSGNNALKGLNSKFHDGPVAVSENTGTIVFNKSIASKGKKSQPRLTLFETTTNKIDAGDATELSFCKTSGNFAHPAFSPSGKMLAFASDMEGTIGGMDLYIAVRNDDGSYAPPISLGNKINSRNEDVYPSFLSDSVLVFSSNKTTGYGGLDLYSITKRSDGSWTEPYLLPAPTNSERDDFHLISESTGANTYLLSSNRYDSDDVLRLTVPANAVGKWELELVDSKTNSPAASKAVSVKYDAPGIAALDTTSSTSGIVPANGKGGMANVKVDGYMAAEAQYASGSHNYFRVVQQKLMLNAVKEIDLNGFIADARTGALIPNALLVIRTNNSVDSVRTDSKGRFTKMFELDPNQNYSIEIGAVGYLNKVVDNITLSANSTQVDMNALADLTLSGVSVGDDLGALLKLNPIYFETGKANITAQGAAELDKITLFLVKNPQLIIECGSHTDCVGNAAANTSLSEKRANSTARYLIDKGIGKSRIRFKGYGETRPVNGCVCEGNTYSCSPEELALNRRTEFRVTESTGTVIASTAGAGAGIASPLAGLRETIGDFTVSGDAKYSEASPVVADPSLPAGLVYSVQVGAFAGTADESLFNGIQPLRKERSHESFLRYCSGTFTSYRDAEAALQVLRSKGFVDAFVTAYRDGVRIPVQDAQVSK
jgi:outer membrane protein OmpA-like peptidoglycan-associated protein